ncbi:MAG TPA: type II toxin-antitoxin system death-on-curing family toxin [Opitutaceae bacterium]|nr:type II toxin-antitoxin system death-on-curing family toxin [Opitutaceae bacterium]
MKEPEWILRETALALQEQSLAGYGGLAGIRDDGMLDAALTRPRQLFAYAKPSLSELAAAYALGLVKNHPFIDGNKRTAFTVAVTFLELNSRRFSAAEADAAVQTLALAAGAINESTYAAWLHANSRHA